MDNGRPQSKDPCQFAAFYSKRPTRLASRNNRPHKPYDPRQQCITHPIADVIVAEQALTLYFSSKGLLYFAHINMRQAA